MGTALVLYHQHGLLQYARQTAHDFCQLGPWASWVLSINPEHCTRIVVAYCPGTRAKMDGRKIVYQQHLQYIQHNRLNCSPYNLSVKISADNYTNGTWLEIAFFSLWMRMNMCSQVIGHGHIWSISLLLTFSTASSTYTYWWQTTNWWHLCNSWSWCHQLDDSHFPWMGWRSLDHDCWNHTLCSGKVAMLFNLLPTTYGLPSWNASLVKLYNSHFINQCEIHNTWQWMLDLLQQVLVRMEGTPISSTTTWTIQLFHSQMDEIKLGAWIVSDTFHMAQHKNISTHVISPLNNAPGRHPTK